MYKFTIICPAVRVIEFQTHRIEWSSFRSDCLARSYQMDPIIYPLLIDTNSRFEVRKVKRHIRTRRWVNLSAWVWWVICTCGSIYRSQIECIVDVNRYCGDFGQTGGCAGSGEWIRGDIAVVTAMPLVNNEVTCSTIR